MISDILVEQDPQVRQQHIEERKRLEEFLKSPAYLAGERVIDSTYTSAIDFLLDAPMDAPGAEAKMHQAIGEARTCRDFKKLFTNRLAELNTAIGALSEDEQ